MVFTSVTIKKVWLPDRQTHAHTDRRRTKWDLWPLTSKINRVHSLITVNMSCKFDKEICNGLVSMVFTSVTIKKVWLPDRQTHAHTDRRRTKWDLWPLTSKINRVHPLITVNMSCKFDKEICNGLVSMVFTSVTIKKVWLPDRQTHAHTDRRRTKWSLCAAMLCRRHNNYIWARGTGKRSNL